MLHSTQSIRTCRIRIYIIVIVYRIRPKCWLNFRTLIFHFENDFSHVKQMKRKIRSTRLCTFLACIRIVYEEFFSIR